MIQRARIAAARIDRATHPRALYLLDISGVFVLLVRADTQPGAGRTLSPGVTQPCYAKTTYAYIC